MDDNTQITVSPPKRRPGRPRKNPLDMQAPAKSAKDVSRVARKEIRRLERKREKEATANPPGPAAPVAAPSDNHTKLCAAIEMMIDAKIAGMRQIQLGGAIPPAVTERIKVARTVMAQAAAAVSR